MGSFGTHGTRQMREWYCAQPSGQAGNWCKRQAVLDQMQKLPTGSADPSQKEARAKLTKEFAAFSKRPEGGGAGEGDGEIRGKSECRDPTCLGRRLPAPE